MFLYIDKLLKHDFEYESFEWYMLEEMQLNHFDTLKDLQVTEFYDTKLRVYIDDKCYDQRSREVNVIEYKGVPFYLYQYIGRGYVKNETVVNAEVMKEFILHHVQKGLDNLSFKQEEEITLESYGAKLYVENNRLTAREK